LCRRGAPATPAGWPGHRLSIQTALGAGFLLNDYRAISDPRARNQIANFDFDEVTAAKLAIDGQIEKCPVAQPTFTVEEKSVCPNLLLRQRTLGADHSSGIPSGPRLHRRIVWRMSHVSSPWP
jgi:hypothetical protein